MSVQVEIILNGPFELSEGPHWDEKQKALFFVDIEAYQIHKYVPATKKHTKTTLDGRVGFIVPVDGTTDKFIVGVERKFLIVQWDGSDETPATVVKEIGMVDAELDPPSRLNDGKADPRGILFAGTMGYESPEGVLSENQGSLYSVGHCGTIKSLVTKVSISNGMSWDLKRNAFYYIDSVERMIRRYDYDADTSKISNWKYIFSLEANKIDGFPDGSTIDADGNLWVAVFGGSCVINVDPTNGKLLKKISIPALQVTSVTFGGENLDILYVTTARYDIGDGFPKPKSGAVFAITGLGVKGTKSMNFKLE